MSDAFSRFSKQLCEFLDSVADMPKDLPLVFRVEVKKVKQGLYHLSNPQLLEAKQDGLIITPSKH